MVSWWSKLNRVINFSASMCGCMVLNAEEKSANRSLAVVLGVSRCLWMVSKMNILASSTPLPALYANCSVSINGSADLVMEFLTILSIAFITKEVRATGLRSFSTLVGPFLGMGMTVECFHFWCTVLQFKEVLNSCWNTSHSCAAQCFTARPQMLSGPVAVLDLVLLRALTTSSLVKVRAESSGWSVEMLQPSTWIGLLQALPDRAEVPLGKGDLHFVLTVKLGLF